MPTLRTVGWIGTSNSSRDTWHGPNTLSFSFFRKIALAISWLLNRRQIPQCPEEQRLRHPRNWTSTAGDFSGIFFRFSYWAIPQNFGTHFPQPLQQCGVFLRLKKYEKHNEDYASTFLQLELPQDGARLPQDRLNASGSRFLRISCLGILQEKSPVSSMFLNILGGRQRWLNTSSGTVLLCKLANTSVP